MASARRDRMGGVPFRTLLVALLLVPVALNALLLVWVADSLVGKVQGADRAVHSLAVDGQVVAAQEAVIDEVIPSFAPVFVERAPLLDDPARASVVAAGLSLVGLDGDRAARQRDLTDRAIAQLDVTSAEKRSLTESLAGIRRLAARRDTSIAAVFDGFETVIAEVRGLQDEQQALLSTSGLPRARAEQVQTALLVSQLVTRFQLERTLRLAVEVSDDADLRQLWLETYGAAAGLSDQVDVKLRGPLGDLWQQVKQAPAVQRREQAGADFLARGLTPATDASALPQLVLALSDVGLANKAFDDLLVRVSEQVRADVHDERAAAVTRLWEVTGVALLALLVVGGVGWTLVRSVTRPLAVLTEDAQRISEGDLVDVAVGGPREVQTVGRALDAAVSTLRQVQNQAQALGQGDLSDAVLSTAVPGPLGAVMHDSIESAVTMVKECDLLQRRLLHLAAHDTLTGLPNRAEVLSQVQQALGRSQREGHGVGLLFVDLDHFKKVNDTYGHAAGDAVLREVAARLSSVVRGGELLGRLGGDEFVCLIEGADDQERLLGLATRIGERLAQPIEVTGRSVTIGTSIGVTLCLDGSVPPEVLLAEADAAAYRAKESGRGGVFVFDSSLREELRDLAVIEDDLAAAIARGQLVLHYQPVTTLGSGRLAGLEALVRWQVPGGPLVQPEEFIPVAERSMLITDLGRWVLGEATRQMVLWQSQGDDVTVAVNISGRHFASPRFVDDVREALAATGARADRLVIELTETVVVDDDNAHAALRQLQAMDVRIALDDFGTGFTSIGQLERLPIDILKIDRGFIASPEPATRALVELMVRSAHAYGLEVIAEGVEDRGQAEWLTGLGCDLAQGFLFSRPQPAAALALAAWDVTGRRAPAP